MSSKKGFDLARNSIYVADPTTELALVGGLALPPGERGEHDTEVDEAHELFDERIDLPMTDEMVANVDAYGVLVPILIAKLDDSGVAYVVDGRQRVRAARLVNKARKARGEPPIKIDCKVRRKDGEGGLLGAMSAANEIRQEDDVPTKIAKFKRLITRGVSPNDAAITFGISKSTGTQWLAYDQNAIAEVKLAVEHGRISQTAAAEIARVKDPAEQGAQLKEMLATAPAGGKVSTRAARKATKTKKAAKKGKTSSGGVVDKRTQRLLLSAVENMSHKNAGEKTLAWWQGVEDALKLVTGDGDVDARLGGLLKEVA